MTVAALVLAGVAALLGLLVAYGYVSEMSARRWPADRGPTCAHPGCLHRAGHLGAHEGERGPV